MQGAVLYAPRDIRFEERDQPKIIKPTDAIIRTSVPASAGRTCGPTAASIPSRNRVRWATSIVALSRKSEVR
jgi:hypothetical protein